MTALLRVQGLSASYGRIEALLGVDLEVPEAAVVSVVGPNGAGKTTLLNALEGLQPSRGAVTFAGERIDQLPPEARLERGLCLISERRELFASMSVEDNLRLGAFVRRREGRAALERSRDEVYARFPRLRERRRQLAGTLSGGERQMLAIGRALMSRPRLLMMDEPSLGLAPRIVEEMFRIVSEMRELGFSILLVEQNARAALGASSYGYVIETGEIALEGPSSELLQDRRVIESYLGAAIQEQEEGGADGQQDREGITGRP